MHSVQEFVEQAFAAVGLNWRDHVEYDARLVTAVEPERLCGNPAKAKRVLGWENQVPFDEMVERLVASEMDAVGRSAAPVAS